ncbi:diacylglycerol/lipid kinase family protein [Caryophanon latum]|uniref:DAGKc domain-containing protein n=1 Tax=Caryophanon latum TaxID=33977 RepID=A0A1C0YTM8_9BACL|nr:diacylglycerol kinase family protein [Caryophanon latum]OCS90509.1 hypothetical protein A6K76_11640 [Caryophanon latum]
MAKAMVIINPTSGKEQGVKYGQMLQQKLASTYTVDLRETAGEGDATRFAREACEAHYDLVVLVGGDGTVHEGIEGLAEQAHRPKVAVVPLGTVNDFARALNIPLDAEQAIDIIGERTKMVDVGKVNDRYFMNLVAVGEVPQAIGDVSIEQKTAIGAFAYFFEGVKAAVANDTFHLRVTYDTGEFEGETMLFLIALTDSVASFRTISEEALVNDGYMHCYVVKAGSLLDTARILTTLFTGDFQDDASIEYFRAKRVQIEANTPLSLNIDGDMLSELPATFTVLPRHLELFYGIEMT